jgi:uncharacterized protein
MYRILALNGGGVRGYFTLEVLKHLEKQSNKKISDMFDLVVGTSSGALIGSLIDTLSPAYISELLRYKLVNELFNPNLLSFGGFLKSKYNTKRKLKCINDLLSFKSCTSNFDYAAVSYDIKNNKVVVFNTLENEETNTYKLIKTFNYADACCASSAAPIYWDPFILDNMILIDGGICATDPTSIAIKLALNKDIKLEDLYIVNIGTGLGTRKYNFVKGSDPIKWLLPLFNVMMNSQTHVANMLYENENLHYYNLDTPLIHSNDNIDCVTQSNFDNLILDFNQFIKEKDTELRTILDTFL